MADAGPVPCDNVPPATAPVLSEDRVYFRLPTKLRPSTTTRADHIRVRSDVGEANLDVVLIDPGRSQSDGDKPLR